MRSGGSSPQVRGRSARVIAFPARGWLIPAGAGQISAPHERNQRGRAHPRRCGADVGATNKLAKKLGSSPQVRGRFPDFEEGRYEIGLIPEGAGQIYSGRTW